MKSCSEEQKLIAGLLEVTTKEGMVALVQASPLTWEPKTMALAMSSFARLIALEKHLHQLEDRLLLLMDLERKLRE